VAQAVESLPGKCKALGTSPQPKLTIFTSLTHVFSSYTMEIRMQCDGMFKVPPAPFTNKTETRHLQFPYLAKLSSKNEADIKNFPDKQK
jgi:hypothetical protein